MLQETSQAISVARVICIVMMTYVHLYFFGLPAAEVTEFHILREIVVDVLGRSSVPLLTVISGFLIVGSLQKYGTGEVLRRRTMNLVIPMVMWNLVWLLFKGPIFPQSTLFDSADDIFAISRDPALAYLGFLRDLFVLSLLAPVFVLLLRKTPFLTLMLAGIIYILHVDIIVILRPQLLFLFLLGIYMAINTGDIWRPSKAIIVLTTIMFGILVATEVASNFEPAMVNVTSNLVYDSLVRRPTVAIMAWVLCLHLSRTELGKRLGKLSVSSFIFFLSHGVIFYIVGAVLVRLPVFHNPWAYISAWVVVPVFSFASICLIHQAFLKNFRTLKEA